MRIVLLWASVVGVALGASVPQESSGLEISQAATNESAVFRSDSRTKGKHNPKFVNYNKSLQSQGGILEINLPVLAVVCLSAGTIIVLLIGSLYYFLGVYCEGRGDGKSEAPLSRAQKRTIRESRHEDVPTAAPVFS